MSKTAKALVIPANREEPIREVTLEGDHLRELQALVSGFIEALPIHSSIDPTGRSTGYVNDSGKLEQLPHNSRGTDMMLPSLFFGDHISGDLVLVGFDPNRGIHLPKLPESVVRRVRLIESEAG